MKLMNQGIDMISWTSKDGTITPVRFRFEENGESVVIKIGKIIQTERDFHCGTPNLLFLCQSMVNGNERLFELCYNGGTHKWLLKKI